MNIENFMLRMENRAMNKNKYLFYRAFYIIVALIVLSAYLLIFLTVIYCNSQSIYFLLLIVPYFAYLGTLYLFYRWLFIPYKETSKIMQLFVKGYTVQGMFELQYPFSPEMEDVINKVKAIYNTQEVMKATKKQAQYLALQNQINPHFLYNSLEGIRGEAILAGLDSIAEMAEALGKFFRYAISNYNNLVTLEDELSNIEDYYYIQQYRFGERLSLSIEIDSENKDEVLKYQLPKLTLQPIVENAIFHGIEKKMGKGHVRIKVETTPKRLIITVSDDGIGMKEERLMELNEKLNVQSFEYVKSDDEKKAGIAMINVNNRIKLLFGEQYGINIFSTENVGTDVEITLPRIFRTEGAIDETRNF
ncbi:sensor histidine kinase [Tepidanaerobacter sp. GT38]|uniref:sensor histidine kinase n=1 Tax=Tepidanaerobacter sp. GT38 TaxID=2722793 RepID=UPI001F20A4D6|nr:sensor histidine kinase [Tepidanaerobacter sp. GT38]